MNNVRLVFGSVADDATLSSADFNANYPVTNLQDRRRIFDAVTTNGTGWKTIRMTWASAQSISCAALLRTSMLPASSDYEFRTYTDAAWTTAEVATTGSFLNKTGSADWYDKVLWPVLRTGVRSAELKVRDTTNPSVISLGRLFVGAYWSPAKNFERSPEIGWNDLSQQSRTAGGSVRTNVGAQYRVHRLKFSNLTETEGSELLAGSRTVGKTEEVLISMFPGVGTEMEIDGLMCGVLPNGPATVMRLYHDVWGGALEVHES